MTTDPMISTFGSFDMAINAGPSPNLTHAQILPNFGRASICSIMPTVIDLFGLKSPSIENLLLSRSFLRGTSGAELFLPHLRQHSYANILVLLIDSVSYTYFRQVLDEFELIPSDSIVFPISSIFPTITQACLPSIWAAGPPAKHGIYGRLFHLAEVNKTTGPFVSSPKSFAGDGSEDDVVRSLLQVPSLARLFTEMGIDLRIFLTISYPRFTSILYGDTNITVGKFLSEESFGNERIQKIRQKDTSILTIDELLLDEVFEEFFKETSGKRLLFVHLLGIAQCMHNYNIESEEFRFAMAGFWRKLQAKLENVEHKCQKGSAVIITADHGAMPLAKEATTYLDETFLEEIEGLSYSLPAGNQRSAYFYPKGKKEGDILKDRLEKKFGDTVSVFAIDDLVHSNLFGVPEKQSYRERPGELLLLNTKGGLVHLAFDLKYKLEKVSDHGGLDPREMIVPLVCILR